MKGLKDESMDRETLTFIVGNFGTWELWNLKFRGRSKTWEFRKVRTANFRN